MNWRNLEKEKHQPKGKQTKPINDYKDSDFFEIILNKKKLFYACQCPIAGGYRVQRTGLIGS